MDRTGLFHFSYTHAINRYISSSYIEEIKLIPIINKRSDTRCLTMLNTNFCLELFSFLSKQRTLTPNLYLRLLIPQFLTNTL